MIKEFDTKDGIADATRGKLRSRHFISQTSCTCGLRLVSANPSRVVLRHADAYTEPEVVQECHLLLIGHLTCSEARWKAEKLHVKPFSLRSAPFFLSFFFYDSRH